MTACELFVLNSTHEGFPRLLLGAMYAGLPVVLRRLATPEVVSDGRNGMLVAPNNPGVLYKTLLQLAFRPRKHGD